MLSRVIESLAMAGTSKILRSSLGLHSLGFYTVFVVLRSIFVLGPCEVLISFLYIYRFGLKTLVDSRDTLTQRS